MRIGGMEGPSWPRPKRITFPGSSATRNVEAGNERLVGQTWCADPKIPQATGASPHA
jgi:hypothetical protein